MIPKGAKVRIKGFPRPVDRNNNLNYNGLIGEVVRVIKSDLANFGGKFSEIMYDYEVEFKNVEVPFARLDPKTRRLIRGRRRMNAKNRFQEGFLDVVELPPPPPPLEENQIPGAVEIIDSEEPATSGQLVQPTLSIQMAPAPSSESTGEELPPAIKSDELVTELPKEAGDVGAGLPKEIVEKLKNKKLAAPRNVPETPPEDVKAQVPPAPPTAPKPEVKEEPKADVNAGLKELLKKIPTEVLEELLDEKKKLGE